MQVRGFNRARQNYYKKVFNPLQPSQNYTSYRLAVCAHRHNERNIKWPSSQRWSASWKSEAAVEFCGNQNWALWHRPTVSEEREMLGMTQRTTSPMSSTKVETLCLGAVFLLRVKDNFIASRWQRTGPCTLKLLDENLLPWKLKMGSGCWMGLPAWRWPPRQHMSG